MKIFWNEKLNIVKKYIDENNKRPSDKDINDDIKQLERWVSHQITNYKTKKYIMSNYIIYNKWSDFINDNNYKKYFMSDEEYWNNNLDDLIKYIDNNGKRPGKDMQKLSNWIGTQMLNYKSRKQIMKNDLIYNKWLEFMNKYKCYFK